MRSWKPFAIATLLLAGIAMLACNIFVSIDRCTTDADCPTGFVCDMQGRFCLDSRIPIDAPTSADGDVEAALEAGPDAPEADADLPPPCNSKAPFVVRGLVPGLEDLPVTSARFSPDETLVLFSATNGCSPERCADLFAASRADTLSAFTVSGPLSRVNESTSPEYWPTVTADGLLLFFESGRSLPPVDGGPPIARARIWSATRVNPTDEFGNPQIQTTFRVDAIEGAPYLHPAGSSLYFVSFGRQGKGGSDIFVAKLDGRTGLASEVKNIDHVNTERSEHAPVVSRDEKVLYFAREAAVTYLRDIYVSVRPNASSEFGAAVPVSELNSRYEDFPSWISDDQCRLYFVSNRPLSGDGGAGAYKLWIAERPK